LNAVGRRAAGHVRRQTPRTVTRGLALEMACACFQSHLEQKATKETKISEFGGYQPVSVIGPSARAASAIVATIVTFP
jgi:hypothetical protein